MKNKDSFKLFANSSELPSSAEQPIQQAKNKRFGKKFYAVMAVIAVVVIVSALFIPQGAATIPLDVNYTVGEKMIYDTTLTMTFNSSSTTLGSALSSLMPNTTSVNAQQTIEVISFDGENYLLNHTTTMTFLNKPVSVSILEKMNKTGYSTYLFNIGNTQQEIPSSGSTSKSYLAQVISKPEAKVGESFTIPYPSTGGLQITGDLTVKFSGLEDLTTSAGTYRVFRIDMISNGISASLAENNPGFNMEGNIDINYQIYLEYGSLRQIKSTMQENIAIQSSIMNATMQLDLNMALVQDIRP